MSTILDLRARRSSAAQPCFFDKDDTEAETGATNRRTPKQVSAEIILFPKASLKALKRPRKKLTRRHATRA